MELKKPGADMSVDAIETQFGFLQGKVLTVMDAVLDGQRCKAAKDLIRDAFRTQLTHIKNVFSGHGDNARCVDAGKPPQWDETKAWPGTQAG